MNLFSGHKPETGVYRTPIIASAAVIFLYDMDYIFSHYE